MTIDEMHRRVLLKINEVGAFVNEDILPEEVDIFINDAIYEFVKQRFNPFGNKYRKGFEDSPKRMEDLRTLVTRTNYTSAKKGTFTFGDYYTDIMELPDDFMLPIAANVIVKEGASIVERPQDYKTNIATYINSTTDLEIDTGDSNDATYFESGDTVYVANENDISISKKLTVETASEDAESTGIFTVTFTSEHGLSSDGFAFYNPQNTKRYIEGTPDNTRDVFAKWIEHRDLYRMLDDPFNRPSARKPLYTMSNNLIYGYATNTFIIDKFNLHYIKQPAKVDAGGSVDCDLPSTVHDEIVDLTSQKILANLGEFGAQYQSQQLTNNE